MQSTEHRDLATLIASFPKDFLFGAATAAYQIEGGQSVDGRGPCIWDSFAVTGHNVWGKQSGAVACDHYHRWPGDLDLMRAAGFDAYRFSIAWPRVLPQGRGAVNQVGLDFYDRLIDGMLERGLKPFATLYHWDLPSALQDQGGWANRDIAAWFADYACLIASRFGDRLASIATLNEPWCIAWLSHRLGAHAPGHRDLRSAARAMHHTLLAHGTAMMAMRAEAGASLRDKLGIVLNFEASEPASDSPADQAAASMNAAIYNRWFIEAIQLGRYPSPALEALTPFMPADYEADMETIGESLDWLGINYYTRGLWQAADPISDDPGDIRAIPGPLEKTAMDWEIYPQGLAQILEWLQGGVTGDLPLYITENGMAGHDVLDRDQVVDEQRCRYFRDHLQVCQQAVQRRVPLKGYFAWSLLDNYEWAFGYDRRFGLVHVDYHTQERRPKQSYAAFQAGLINRWDAKV